MKENNIRQLRKKIDALDTGLLSLLNARASLSMEIGAVKRSEQKPVYAPDREREVIERLAAANRGPVAPASLRAIYREIMSSSLSLEKPLEVAYLGPECTFTHQASVKKFGHSVRYLACDSISDIFAEVENGRCDYGVAPVENSTEGAIYHTLDSFIDSDLKICSEIIMRINLNLLSREKSLRSVKKVYSNPQVFGQCRLWLETHAPKAVHMPVASTTLAAKIAGTEKEAACVASILAAERYNLEVLGQSIQDSASNVTRFLVLSNQSARPTRSDKTSIVLSIKDRPGALHRVLLPFRKEGINLTKIESRPSKRKQWDYYFFIDFESHITDKKVARALKQVEKECAFLKILGSYPRAN